MKVRMWGNAFDVLDDDSGGGDGIGGSIGGG